MFNTTIATVIYGKRMRAGFPGVIPFVLHVFLLLFFKYSTVVSSLTLAPMESF